MRAAFEKTGRAGLSVIIPCRNAGMFITKTVASVYAHNISNRPLEIIIIDDASTDAATHKALEQIKSASDVKIFRLQKHGGQSRARNLALTEARYPYIFPIDADDLMNNDFQLLAEEGSYFDQAIEHLENNSDTVLAFPDCRLFGARKGLYSNSLPPYHEKTILARNMIGVYGIFRTAEARAMGGYDEKLFFAEDWGFWLALLNKRVEKVQARDVKFIPQDYYLYRQHEHRKNVNAHRPDWQYMAEHFLRRAPSLYRYHLPNLPEDFKAAATVLKKTIVRVQWGMDELAKFNPAVEPILRAHHPEAFHSGMPGTLLRTFYRNMRGSQPFEAATAVKNWLLDLAHSDSTEEFNSDQRTFHL